MHLSFFMSSNRPRGKRRLAAPSTAVSAFVLFALAMIIIVIPKMTYAQQGLFPLPSANEEVLPTYISRTIPGAAFEGSLFHYYPEDIAIPAGTTIAWFNDDPGQPHTVTSGNPDGPSNIFNSDLMPYNSFFQYTFDEAGTFDYHCTIHPWRTGTVTVSDAVELGRNFELRSGTGPILDLTEYNSTVIDIKPITFTPPRTTPVTYNLSLLAPNTQEEVFSESFFVLDNDLQVELVNNATMNRTQAYGPDITDPITGTYHVIGNLFEISGEYTIRVEALTIGNTTPTERIVDEFSIQVVTT
jgi:plastocyanin